MLFRGRIATLLGKLNLLPAVFQTSRVYSYPATVQGMLVKGRARLLRVSLRLANVGQIVRGAALMPRYSLDQRQLFQAVAKRNLSRERGKGIFGDEQIVFINAWNEWAEGCHLETRSKMGARLSGGSTCCAFGNTRHGGSHCPREEFQQSEALLTTILAHESMVFGHSQNCCGHAVASETPAAPPVNLPVSLSIAIVLLNWNGVEDTRACLDSLAALTYPNFNVIAVTMARPTIR